LSSKDADEVRSDDEPSKVAFVAACAACALIEILLGVHFAIISSSARPPAKFRFLKNAGPNGTRDPGVSCRFK
jgi:hypothetical protein